jgi:hypothetical protein
LLSLYASNVKVKATTPKTPRDHGRETQLGTVRSLAIEQDVLTLAY